MKDIIKNILSLLDSFVFSDIWKNPPTPYDKYKVDIKNKFDEIKTDIKRPFYDFYRDIRMALSNFKDTNLEILGYEVPLGEEVVNFKDYRKCLPFKFYLDYKTNETVKMYIKEYPSCSKHYDEETINNIKKHENIALESINGIEPFKFIQEFSNEFYRLKNMDSQFASMIDTMHDSGLTYQPLTPNQLNNIKELNSNNKNTNEEIKVDGTFIWEIQSKGGEIKCHVDSKNHLNVIVFSYKLYDEDDTISKCSSLFYTNDFKIVIITSQLYEDDNINAYYVAQLLFPKIDIKFNFAMKTTDLNKQLYDTDPSQFLDPKTCRPFEKWDDFIEPSPEKYGFSICIDDRYNA